MQQSTNRLTPALGMTPTRDILKSKTYRNLSKERLDVFKNPNLIVGITLTQTSYQPFCIIECVQNYTNFKKSIKSALNLKQTMANLFADF